MSATVCRVRLCLLSTHVRLVYMKFSVEAAIVPPSTRDGDGSRPGLTGSAGAIEAVELTWRNVNYSVDMGKKGKKEVRFQSEDLMGSL